MILGICGSGRKEGNTGKLVEEALKGTGSETELVWLIDLNIGYCTGCMKCALEGKCWQEDGMTGLYKKLIECEALVIGSPCYYGDVSGLVKSMMDRSIALGYMGIDFVIDQRYGPQILELNVRPGLEIQNVNGKGLRKRLYELETKK